jgi:hypothetical protein
MVRLLCCNKSYNLAGQLPQAASPQTGQKISSKRQFFRRYEHMILPSANRTKTFHVKQFCPIEALNRSKLMVERSASLRQTRALSSHFFCEIFWLCG